jgi:hypothetical protein
MGSAAIEPDAGPERITLAPVGVVRSPFQRLGGMPLQSVAGAEVHGQVVLGAEFEPGLRDLDGFSHLHLITFLHRGKPGGATGSTRDSCSALASFRPPLRVWRSCATANWSSSATVGPARSRACSRADPSR